jgi:alpha-N-arabinofuranosidase
VEFDEPLGLFWNYLRNPHREQYSLDERPGWLRLKGSAEKLGMEVSPAFLGRRQRHFHVTAETLLDFEPQENGEEAGLVAYMNSRHHYEIAVVKKDDVKKLIFRRQIGTLVKIENEVELDDGFVTLYVDVDKYWYRFSYSQGEGQVIPFGAGEVQYLSTEVGGAFTGVYLAMYATGNGKECSVPADFDYFTYHIKPEEFDDEKESMLDLDDI